MRTPTSSTVRLLVGVLGLLVGAPAAAQPAADAPTVGDVAPDFAARTLDGDTLRLGDLRGRHVLLEFWASWCAPCIASAPALAALYAETPRDRFEIVGVALDDADSVRAFAERFGHAWPQIVEPNVHGRPVTRAYDVVGYPTSLVIDPDGVIVYRGEGGLSDLGAVVREALGEAAK